jgi:GTPase
MKFVDEITIEAEAGRGGDGVVRWRQDKFESMGGPQGGNGGRGGDIYMRAVRDVNLLAQYTGAKIFTAENGGAGEERSRHGRNGKDLTIEVPVGAVVTHQESGRVFHFDTEGQTHKILIGGQGGLGNEHFKSSTNRSPEKATKGRSGEKGIFYIELQLVVDIGIIGFPNAGKSTLLNALTNARSRIGAYPFTTLEPYLGDLHGYILADIPGLIEGASEGKGLGHKFLRHVERTKMLVHCISLESDTPVEDYQTIRNELCKFDPTLKDKEVWILLTKSDLKTDDEIAQKKELLSRHAERVYVLSAELGEGVKEFSDNLVRHLRSKENVTKL